MDRDQLQNEDSSIPGFLYWLYINSKKGSIWAGTDDSRISI